MDFKTAPMPKMASTQKVVREGLESYAYLGPFLTLFKHRIPNEHIDQHTSKPQTTSLKAHTTRLTYLCSPKGDVEKAVQKWIAFNSSTRNGALIL